MTESPHVLVDATAIPRNRGGVGRYLEHLLPALDAGGQRMTILTQGEDAGWMSRSAPSADVVVPRAKIAERPRRLAWEQVGLPRIAKRRGADVIFSPHYTMPVLAGMPVVVTLHDATFFSHPELHGRGKGEFFRRWSRYSLAHAAATIVPSAATASELERWAGTPTPPSVVAYHGVDASVFDVPTARQRDAARVLVGHDEWIAFLGTIEPRKNIGALVAAFSTLLADPASTGRHPDLALALAGGSGWDETVDAAIEASGVGHRIVRLGFVPDDELAGLLGGSLLVAYPSLGEGFGLPVLEAMATGAPVLTTPILALPEVGGDVAVYTEPDAPSIAAALAQMIGDPEDRARRGQAGIDRAAQFSWAASAAIHAEVFARAAAGKND